MQSTLKTAIRIALCLSISSILYTMDPGILETKNPIHITTYRKVLGALQQYTILHESNQVHDGNRLIFGKSSCFCSSLEIYRGHLMDLSKNTKINKESIRNHFKSYTTGQYNFLMEVFNGHEVGQSILTQLWLDTHPEIDLSS